MLIIFMNIEPLFGYDIICLGYQVHCSYRLLYCSMVVRMCLS